MLDARERLVEAALAYVEALERQDADHRAGRRNDKPWAYQSHEAMIDAAQAYRGET